MGPIMLFTFTDNSSACEEGGKASDCGQAISGSALLPCDEPPCPNRKNQNGDGFLVLCKCIAALHSLDKDEREVIRYPCGRLANKPRFYEALC